MTVIRTLWYLAGLFTFALVFTSGISVLPGSQRAIAILAIVLLALAICSAFGALLLRHLHRKRPEAVVFTSKALAWFAVSVAAVLTLFVFFGVAG